MQRNHFKIGGEEGVGHKLFNLSQLRTGQYLNVTAEDRKLNDE